MITRIGCGGFDIDNETLIEEDGVLKAKNGGGGGGNSDWNASEGEPGYILNRPFYEETEIVTETWHDGEATFEAATTPMGTFTSFDKIDSSITVNYPGDTGNTFTLTIDGEEYVFDDNTPRDPQWQGLPRIGDWIFYVENGMLQIINVGISEAFTADVKIVATLLKTVVAKTLDEKFLPDLPGPKICFIYAEISDELQYISYGSDPNDLKSAFDDGADFLNTVLLLDHRDEYSGFVELVRADWSRGGVEWRQIDAVRTKNGDRFPVYIEVNYFDDVLQKIRTAVYSVAVDSYEWDSDNNKYASATISSITVTVTTHS